MFSLATCIIAYIVIVYQTTVYLFLFTLIFIGIGVGYNLGVKRMGFIGNIWVSSGYVAPLFMGFFMLNPTNSTAIFTCFLILNTTFFLSVGREIVKDIQDYSGDKSLQLNSLAVKYGPDNAGYVALFFFTVTIIASIIAGLIIYQNIIFWILDFFFLLTLILTIYTVLTEKSEGGKKARKYTRWSLWIALSALRSWSRSSRKSTPTNLRAGHAIAGIARRLYSGNVSTRGQIMGTIKREACDHWFSKAVRLRDGECLHCHRVENLECCHIFGRRNKRLRWAMSNAIAMLKRGEGTGRPWIHTPGHMFHLF